MTGLIITMERWLVDKTSTVRSTEQYNNPTLNPAGQYGLPNSTISPKSQPSN